MYYHRWYFNIYHFLIKYMPYNEFSDGRVQDIQINLKPEQWNKKKKIDTKYSPF